jgi:pSer/pThr/pTyr-binding forkhead associated (FHA) protein
MGGPKPGKINSGRLFGWLVSYSSPEGRSIELREGKFFVTGSSLKNTDLVLDDSSVSTPHALMTVSGETGLYVQDLMSERGVHVRSREGQGYQREELTTQLKHGDWIRFGEVEFLVSLLPNKG